MKKLILIAPLALPLSACISFGGKPPSSLLTLDAAVETPVGETRSSAGSATMTVTIPNVPHELATNRIPVHSGGTAIAYVKDAQWVEAPPRLFARLVSDTIAVRTGRVILNPRQSQLDPGAMLSGELRMFGVEASGDAGTAVVTYDAVLVRGEPGVFEKRRFEARVPVSPIEAAAVSAALSEAANRVAAEVSDWVGR